MPSRNALARLLAEVARRLEHPDLAASQAVLERYVAVAGGDPVAHAALGELALRRGDEAAAAHHFGLTLRADDPALAPVKRWVKARWAAAAWGTPRRPGCAR